VKWIFIVVVAVLSGCANGLRNFSPYGQRDLSVSRLNTAPPGYHYPTGNFDKPVPNDVCQSSSVNSAGVISWINSSVGKPSGIKNKVARIDNSSDTQITDLLALGFPADVGNSSFACNATLLFENGESARGIIDLHDPGQSMPLEVRWADEQEINSAVEKADAARKVRADQSIAYSQHATSCNLAFSIGIQAKSLVSAGMSEDQVADHLVAKYAFGPNGESYRDSADREKVIDNIAANPGEYGSQEFLSECMARAKQAGS